MPTKTAIIIGAGPAGLTAAYELATRTDIRPIVLERSTYMGGISRTINYKGNRIDLGGHRFFSKSDRVMEWWLSHLPLEKEGKAAREDKLMLVRSRKSRIYFLRKFFDYPIQLSLATLANLGLRRTMRIGFSYIRSAAVSRRRRSRISNSSSSAALAASCTSLSSSRTPRKCGAFRARTSARNGARNASRGFRSRRRCCISSPEAAAKTRALPQKETETSLIEHFLYPKVWTRARCGRKSREKCVERGGQIITDFDVTSLEVQEGRGVAVAGVDAPGQGSALRGRLFFLYNFRAGAGARAEDGSSSRTCAKSREGLQYRDFITVGLLLSGLKIKDPGNDAAKFVRDNWIYMQEPGSPRGTPADLQQLEPLPGRRSRQRVDWRGVLLLRRTTNCGSCQTKIWRGWPSKN